jgi:hypothetical protein
MKLAVKASGDRTVMVILVVMVVVVVVVVWGDFARGRFF